MAKLHLSHLHLYGITSCVPVSRVQVTNLIEGHEYYFRVFAHNAAGPSEQPAELKPAVKARLPFGMKAL